MGEDVNGGMRYKKSPFHEEYCSIIDRFARGEIKKLMVSVPPQHGKSEIATRRLPAYLFGHNPDLKIVISCILVRSVSLITLLLIVKEAMVVSVFIKSTRTNSPFQSLRHLILRLK